MYNAILLRVLYQYTLVIVTNKICLGGRVERWCWVNFQRRGVLLIWSRVGQGWGCLDSFSFIYHFSFLTPSLWETAQYRLKYCLKGPLSPKQPTNQPTNQPNKICLWMLINNHFACNGCLTKYFYGSYINGHY